MRPWAVWLLGSARLAGGEARDGGGAEPCEAEVEQLRAARREHDVARLQVAMNDPLRMRSGERLGDLDGRAQGLRERHRPFAQPRRQRFTFEILHDEEVEPVLVTHLVDRTDAWMRQSRDGAGLVRETRPATRIGCGVRREHLDGDVAIESRVAGPVDLAHPPCADKTLDVENPEPHPARQGRWGGSRLVNVRRAGASWTAGKEAFGVTVCRQQRLHLLAQVRILATLVREKRRTLGLRPCKGRVEEGEDVFPTVGGHSRSFVR